MGNGGTKWTFTDLPWGNHLEMIWIFQPTKIKHKQHRLTPDIFKLAIVQSRTSHIFSVHRNDHSVLHGIILGVCAFHHPERDSMFFTDIAPISMGIYSNMFSYNASSMVDFVGLHGYPHLFTQITGNQNVYHHGPIKKKTDVQPNRMGLLSGKHTKSDGIDGP